MVLYEVSLAVDAEIAEAYAAWLAPHIAEMLALDAFTHAMWYDVEGDDPARVHWCVQYRARDRGALQAYLDRDAARMRGDGLSRFRGRFTATRRVLTSRPSGGG